MYLTADEYCTITDKPAEDATIQRLTLASMLLDARIGAHQTNEDGWKIDDVTDLPEIQKNAVQNWVAGMVSYLKDNADQPPSTASVTLGKFSVSKQGGKSSGMVVPEEMGYQDLILISSGMIKRGITVK